MIGTMNSILSELLQIPRGVTAIIGSGGKTTLMHVLAGELLRNGTVIVTTSTHIFPSHLFSFVETSGQNGREKLIHALETERAVCIGTPAADGKLAAPELSFEEMSLLADYVLVEADGSKGLPLKAHAPHEPVIPECSRLTLLAAGINGIGKPVSKVCHRPQIWASCAECSVDTIVSPELLARVIEREGLGDAVFLNQVEEERDVLAAREVAGMLAVPVYAGSLHRKVYSRLSATIT